MKKQHPCGSNEWEITRVGVDIKIKCLNILTKKELIFNSVKECAIFLKKKIIDLLLQE